MSNKLTDAMIREALTKAITGVIMQGKPSMGDTGSSELQCKYNGNDGCHCAVGFLIGDEHYTADLEGLPARSDEVSTAVANTLGVPYDPDDKDFITLQGYLTALQRCHDAASDKSNFVTAFVQKVVNRSNCALYPIPAYCATVATEALAKREENKANA